MRYHPVRARIETRVPRLVPRVHSWQPEVDTAALYEQSRDQSVTFGFTSLFSPCDRSSFIGVDLDRSQGRNGPEFRGLSRREDGGRAHAARPQDDPEGALAGDETDHEFSLLRWARGPYAKA